jgi:hypothetical protein
MFKKNGNNHSETSHKNGLTIMDSLIHADPSLNQKIEEPHWQKLLRMYEDVDKQMISNTDN